MESVISVSNLVKQYKAASSPAVDGISLAVGKGEFFAFDAVSRRGLWNYINNVRNDYGTTVFLTTHYIDKAEKVDTVCIINHGKIVGYSSPVEMKRSLLRQELILDAADRDALTAKLSEFNLSYKTNGQIREKQMNIYGYGAILIDNLVKPPISIKEQRTRSGSNKQRLYCFLLVAFSVDLLGKIQYNNIDLLGQYAFLDCEG